MFTHMPWLKMLVNTNFGINVKFLQSWIYPYSVEYLVTLMYAASQMFYCTNESAMSQQHKAYLDENNGTGSERTL